MVLEGSVFIEFEYKAAANTFVALDTKPAYICAYLYVHRIALVEGDDL